MGAVPIQTDVSHNRCPTNRSSIKTTYSCYLF